MRRFLERLRAARYVEIGVLLVALALLGLALATAALPAGDAGATDMERRLCRLLEGIDGVGRVRVMIAEDGGGAVIVASQLDDVRTALQVQLAAKALLDIDLDRICVIGRRMSFGGEGG